MSMDNSHSEESDSITARRQEAARSQEIVSGAAVMLGWTAAVVALFIGSLVSYVGWIPERLTHPDGIFSTHGLWPYITVALGFGVVVRFLRFRALVRMDARSQRTAELFGFAFDGLLVLALLSGMIGLYAVVASVSLEAFGLPTTISAILAGLIGLAVVGSAYGVSLLTHRRGWRSIAQDSELDGVAGGALALLLALPVACLFGFLTCFFLIAALEGLGYQVESFRAFLADNTLMFPTAAFLALTGIIHAGRRALWREPVGGPNFVGTMMITGMLVFMAAIGLIAFTVRK